MPDLSYARIRFACALATVAAGTMLAVSAFTFAPETIRWIALGSGCAVLMVLATAFAVAGRGTAQRVLDLPLALVCAWAIVCARAIEQGGAGASPAAVKWFNLAAGAAIAGFGVVALLLHEYGLERDLRWAGEHAGARAAGR